MTITLSESHIIYSPVNPGQGWVSVGEGPLGGKKWKYVAPPPKIEPPAAPAYRPSRAPDTPGRGLQGPAIAPPAAPPPGPPPPAPTAPPPLDARYANRLEPVNFGGSMPLIKSVMSTPENPMSHLDHAVIGQSHARAGAAYGASGRLDLATAHFAAARFHNEMSQKKRPPTPLPTVPPPRPTRPPPRKKEHYEHVKGLQADQSIPTEHRELFTKSYWRAIKSMPEAARARLKDGLSEVKFVGSRQGATEEWNREGGQQLSGSVLVSGYFRTDTAKMVLDGATTMDEETVHRIYLHEMFHAIDGSGDTWRNGQRLSQSKEWNDIFKTELASSQLTKYASTNAEEGFAEFGRHAHGHGPEMRKKMEATMPKAVDFFKKRGLWESGVGGEQLTKTTLGQVGKPSSVALPVIEKEAITRG